MSTETTNRAAGAGTTPDVETVRALIAEHNNWGRWGADDQVGTLNHVTPAHLVEAAATIRTGKRFSLALPFDADGPQRGGFGRFNPVHLMFRDGGDIATGTIVDDFYGGKDRHCRGTDDLIIMPLQSGTQWDALAHILFDGTMYNGYQPTAVTSKGATRNDIAQAADRIAGRGVLLDLPRFKGVDALADGYAISSADLDGCAASQDVEVRPGDFVLIRTGQLQARRGAWGDYAGGSAPGMGLDSVPWVARNEIAGLATDTWGMEVLPNETPDVFQPLHCVFLVGMGLYVGEIFDLETLAGDCAADGRYEFFFCAPPLPFSRAVGSPVNPMAIK
ncbi:cyclase family protein [Amycolatopsis sp. NPDC051903]|uniref:cyclase family protein n=1 Tax=Amycolatopsis sp. NPDC051903 TaxID=3363936 RepID=UPI0037A56ED8